MSDARLKALEAVAEAARVMWSEVLGKPPIERTNIGQRAARVAFEDAYRALDALPAQPQPQPAGEVVEVRQAILWHDENRTAIAIDPSGLNDWWPGYRHVGFSVARVPLPTIPTTVEPGA